MTRPGRTVAIVGAGLAGMVSATSALAEGAGVVVFERGDGPGGATADSAGWIWRYRDVAFARTCAPHGDPVVQRAVVDGLDEDLQWLERHGVVLHSRDTRREFTRGARVDPRQALDRLAGLLDRAAPEALRLRTRVVGARRAGSGAVELFVERVLPDGVSQPPGVWEAFDAVVFAGGGYAADLQRIASEADAADGVLRHWTLRAPHAGDGSSLDAAMQLGALRVAATGESLTRLVPSGASSRDALVRGGELQVPGSRLVDAAGVPVEQAPHDWSGAQAAWRFARSSGSGRLEFDRAALRTPLHAGGVVEDAIRAAIADGTESGRTVEGRVWLSVHAGITGTRCGLRVDEHGRLLQAGVSRRWRADGAPAPIPGAYAAGIDAACTGLGGTASGLAQALVLGRAAGARAASPG